MRQARLLLLLASTLLCGGCFQFSTVLAVKGDGSGTIDQRMIFTPAAVAQLKQFSALGGGGSLEPITEQQARDAAATMGTGVTYVSSTPINSNEGVGRDIRYAFTDISQLRLDETPPAPGGISLGPANAAPRVSFKMSRQANGQATLTVFVPQLPIVPGSTPARGGNMPSADQLMLLKPMLAGAHMSVAIEPQGTLVSTSSPYVTGQRVTLVDVPVDALLDDDTLSARMQAAKTPEEAKAILARVPGLKVNLDPEVTIVFTPR